MNTLFIALLDAAPQQGQGSMMPSIIMMVVLFAIVYFFMIRPQNKKQKAVEKFRSELKVDDEVVTIGGIHGTIAQINQEKRTVVLTVAPGTKMTFELSAILPKGTQPEQR